MPGRERLKRQLAALSEAEQARFDGRPATDQTFDAWIRTRSDAEQRAILGVKRFELWQAGKLQLTQLVDQFHRPLTLEQLETKRRGQ